MTAVSIDDVDLASFRLEDGHLLLNLKAFNPYNDLVLEVEDNALVLASDQWDAELVGRRLVLRLAARRILLDVEFTPPNTIAVSRGQFLYNGIQAAVTDGLLWVVNNDSRIANGHFSDCSSGVLLGHCNPTRAGGIVQPRIDRYRGIVDYVSEARSGGA